MSTQKIHVSTKIQRDIQTIWNAWTQPEHVIHWNFASDTWHCPKASNDLQVGGKFSYTMASKDGEMSFDFEGVYNEVIPEQKIAYAMSDGRQVEIHFTKVADGILVEEIFDPEQMNPLDLQQAGWQAILNQFTKYTEGL